MPARADRSAMAVGRACCFGALCVLALLTGCEEERRVVRWDPMLGNLPGAQTGTPYVREMKGYVDPTRIPAEDLRKEADDGKVTLTARTGRHLMMHIYVTLDKNERDLFTEQVLSEVTKREYYSRGKDPREAFDTLRERWEDVNMLFDTIPAGEFTPGVFARNMGDGVRRIEVQGPAAAGLHWTGMDMVMERGNWKLRWFVSPE